MRDAQLFALRYDIIVEDDIQIQCPWSPAKEAFPAGSLLDAVEFVQQLFGFKKSA